MTLLEMGLRARNAANALACMGSEEKNAALTAISQALLERSGEILAANREDIALAENAGLSKAMIERLTLTQERLAGIARAILKVRDLPDPVGEVLEARTLYNGLRLEKRRVPMGVICVIYESRPNVTVDSAVLCLKAGSAAILRGGKETIRSNLALEAVMRAALESVHANPDCVQLVHDTARETARELMGMRGAIDLLIPRGGAGLIRSVVENAKVPVIETGAGNCHVYVDAKANLEMAAGIIQNAKMQRPSVCIRMWRRSFCPWRSARWRAANCAGARARRLSCRASLWPRKKITPRNTTITFWPCAWWIRWKRPLRTSRATPRTIPKPS